MYKNAVYYFIALMAVLVVGFWPSYYSKFFADITFGQHFHGVTMTLWCLLLIIQAWLMKTGRNRYHRSVGKIAFVLGPLVSIAAFYVAFDFIAKVKQPFSERALAIHWFGLFLAVLFTWLFFQALRHRKNARLHASYMVCTAMVFLIPGLGRAVGSATEMIGISSPPFVITMSIPALIAVILLWKVPQQRKLTAPIYLFAIAWIINVGLYLTLPYAQWWVDFTLWSSRLLA
ncbi:hypothetical protein LJ739_17320 [Aestuariibacter halophilus]|uniref:DUF2306 domain-containing protein n=1 Tax=Fluctibacter halophilus TaxID=226011 RepID=A0ABS8GCA9_9ALTE|nr:hypothetical protein [Aestuariibacter halophilus]MCC2618018.1 hypothetical protein [Aestuariibacter halophilus]